MPVGINGVSKQGVGVNGVQIKQALSAANETVAKGVYVATTLSTVDTDLAVGNIKDGETIFGFLGTFEGAAGALAVDTSGYAESSLARDGFVSAAAINYKDISAGGDLDIVSVTPTFDASSLAFGAGIFYSSCDTASKMKIRLFMGGVQVAESAYLTAPSPPEMENVSGFRALSGSQICKLTAHNYGAGTQQYRSVVDTGAPLETQGIAVGSVKLA